MKIKAKRDIAYDFEEYGIDFKKNGIYVSEKDKDGYYVNETENGSGVWITDEDIHNDFDVEEEWTMFTYKFSDSKGNIYYGQFKNRDAACEYAYKAGLCFEGRVS